MSSDGTLKDTSLCPAVFAGSSMHTREAFDSNALLKSQL